MEGQDEVLDGLLGSVRARGAVLWRADRVPPWSWVSDEAAPLTLYAVLRGSASLAVRDALEDPADGSAHAVLSAWLRPGDTALVRGPHPHTVSDAPHTPPQVRIHAARHCVPLRPPRTALPAPRAGDGTVLFAGAYQARDEIGGSLLDALPALLTVPAPTGASPAVLGLLDEETEAAPADRTDAGAAGRRPGVDRLLDLLLVRTLKAWFDGPGTAAPGWYGALGDPVAGPALRAVHADPARAWTADALAALAGVSRATFYRHFRERVGQPPLTYLSELRMSRAAGLLRDPGATVEGVARRVGYQDPFAFSTAFRRAHGHPPSEAARGG
ncbi:AraC family transcriptional regulator [Streptomyces sp. NPDC003032]